VEKKYRMDSKGMIKDEEITGTFKKAKTSNGTTD